MQSPALAAAAAALVATLLYLPSISFTYVYDDVPIAQTDTRLEDPWYFAKVWWQPWWPEGGPKAETRPLTSLTFWAHMQLHGAKPLPVHLGNILIFAFLSALVALLAARWLGHPWLAWPVGLIFAAHPIHVEVVAGVVGRAETLSACWVAAALLCWLRWRDQMSWLRAGALGLLVLLAGLSKETGYLAAPILVAAELAQRRREASPLLRRSCLVPMLVSFALVALLAAAQRAIVVGRLPEPAAQYVGHINPADNPMVAASPAERVVTPIKLSGQAALLLLLPFNQSPDYSPRQLMPTADLSDPLVMLGGCVILFWCTCTVLAWRHRWPILGPLLAWPITWIVASNSVILIGTIFGERLLTLLSMFVPMVLVGLVAQAVERSGQPARVQRWILLAAGAAMMGLLVLVALCASPGFLVALDPALPWRIAAAVTVVSAATVWYAWRTRRVVAAATVGLLVLGYSCTTLCYLPSWRDWPALVVSTVQRHPDGGRFQGFLAQHYMEQAQRTGQEEPWYGWADEAAREALRLWPDQAPPYVVLACIALRHGDRAQAGYYIQQARQYAKQPGDVEKGLAALGFDREDFASDAVTGQQLRKLQEQYAQRPDDAQLARQLARQLVAAGRPAEGAALYRKLLDDDARRWKDEQLLDELSEALMQTGNSAALAQLYERWIALRPSRWDLCVNGALALLAADGDGAQARRWIERAIRLKPDNGSPWAALALWYERNEQYAEAVAALDKAIKLTGADDPRRRHYQYTRRRLLDKIGS